MDTPEIDVLKVEDGNTPLQIIITDTNRTNINIK